MSKNKNKNNSKPAPLKATHCPGTLTGEARERWLWLVKSAPEGRLVISDAGSVSVLACALALHEQAAAKVAEFGPVILAGTKADVNPWLGILNAQAAIISKASRDVGLKNWRVAPAAERARADKGPAGTVSGKKEAARADAAETLNAPAGDWGSDLNPLSVN